MDPTEGLPIALARSAIVCATRKVIKYGFREFAFGFAFKIMQVEQIRSFGLIGAGAFSVGNAILVMLCCDPGTKKLCAFSMLRINLWAPALLG